MKTDAPLLITTPTNIRYLTGFVGAQPEEREAYCLWNDSSLYLFTNALYMEEAKQLSNSQILKLSNQQIRIIEISREKPLSTELKKILLSVIPVLAAPAPDSIRGKAGIQEKEDWIPDQVGDDKINGGRDDIRLEYEEENLTVAELKKLRKELKGVKLVPTRGKIEEMRMIKREDEIASIRKACTITDQCFLYLAAKLTPGVEERAIALEIEMFFRKRGAGLAFSPIVAFGKNSSKPHYSGAKKRGNEETKLQKNDIVLLDFGARVNGYCADMTRVVFIGKPKDEWKKAYVAVLDAQITAFDELNRFIDVSRKSNKKTPISGATMDRAARDVIEKAGLPTYPHSLGHAVGLDIHEAPQLTVKKDQMLKPGMVVSVEPGVYIEGQFGIRIEDLVLITDDGVEVLSKSPKQLSIL